jgi:hypothetical protein
MQLLLTIWITLCIEYWQAIAVGIKLEFHSSPCTLCSLDTWYRQKNKHELCFKPFNGLKPLDRNGKSKSQTLKYKASHTVLTQHQWISTLDHMQSSSCVDAWFPNWRVLQFVGEECLWYILVHVRFYYYKVCVLTQLFL